MPVILLVEDEIGEQLAAFLERSLDAMVVNYQDGLKASEDISNGLKYDIAIIDASLPNVSGDEITNLSKKYQPDSKVIFISGYPIRTDADYKMLKPLDLDKLLRKVQEYLE